MSAEILQQLRIVMVYPAHPGNIGAAARAIKNMGISKLVLVSPNRFPSFEAYQRAASADDVLEHAVVVESLEQALQGCVYVVGTSARSRTLEWQVDAPDICAQKCLSAATEGEVAIVFGRERSGLTNKELEQCNSLVHIPTDSAYSSLNVAAAIQIMSYELRRTMLKNKLMPVEKPTPKYRDDLPASADQLDGLYRHLFTTLTELNFFGSHHPEKLMRRIKSLFNRARTTQREVAIFRGICSAVQRRKSAYKKQV